MSWTRCAVGLGLLWHVVRPATAVSFQLLGYLAARKVMWSVYIGLWLFGCCCVEDGMLTNTPYRTMAFGSAIKATPSLL